MRISDKRMIATHVCWFLFFSLLMWASARSQECIDVELVLLADVSQSMTLPQRKVQREGYANAFRSQLVMDQIAAGACGAIAVQYVEWNDEQTIVADWTIIRSIVEGHDFAQQIEDAPDKHTGSMTGFAAAMDFAAQEILNNKIEANWRVVDVSSDGVNTDGPSPESVRDRYTQGPFWEQITFNGLPIFKGDHFKEGQRKFFTEEVVGGPRSFLADSITIDEIHEAIILKISQEIG